MPKDTPPIASTARRAFKHGSVVLTDPNPDMTPEQVKTFYATQHPELLNAGVGSPETDLKAGTVTYTFVANYGRKG
ncbi:PRTRC system protein C [Deinococcus frigens]|uniref:PRTRC system protein C n=1 Tax=Deinococcus frigens TaxID=249403 RepID=UPI000555DC68|nr:PRTRC system protein C [Deinococcus frigens]